MYLQNLTQLTFKFIYKIVQSLGTEVMTKAAESLYLL